MRWLDDAERVDLAVYAAVARTPAPALARAMSRLSSAADYLRLSMAAAPLRALAAAVGYSRVLTGVHHPGDVLAGALMGTTPAQLTTYVGNRLV